MDQSEASRDECRNAVTPSASQWGQSWTLVELRAMMCSLFSRVVKAARHAPRRSRAGSCQKAIERSDITEPCPSGLFGLEHLSNEGWICEEHHDRGWPHDDCAGPGVPCPDCNRQSPPTLPSDWATSVRVEIKVSNAHLARFNGGHDRREGR
jgi:hypothetical protein